MWRTDLVAPPHMGSSHTRDQTHVPLCWQVDSYPVYPHRSPPNSAFDCFGYHEKKRPMGGWIDGYITEWIPESIASAFAGEDFSGAIQAGCCSANTEIERYPHYIQLPPHGSEGSWEKRGQRTAGQSNGENHTGGGMGLLSASKYQLFRTLGKQRETVSVAGVRTDHGKLQRGSQEKTKAARGSRLNQKTRPAEAAPASSWGNKWRFMPEPGYKVSAV